MRSAPLSHLTLHSFPALPRKVHHCIMQTTASPHTLRIPHTSRIPHTPHTPHHTPHTPHTPRHANFRTTSHPPRKRQRLTPRSSPAPPPHTPKRKRISVEKPARKRRSLAAQDANRPNKRFRQAVDDVNMVDTNINTGHHSIHSHVRKRRRTVRDDLRARKFQNGGPPCFLHTSSQAMSALSPIAADISQPQKQPPAPVEELDISETSNMDGGPGNGHDDDQYGPLHAELLEDGRCMVRIVRSDGRVDFYTLLPLQEQHY